MARSAHYGLLCWGLLAGWATCACASKDHAPYADPDRASGGRAAIVPDEQPSDTGGAPEADPGEAPDVVEDLDDGLFSQGQVYALGQLRGGKDFWAIVDSRAPRTFYTGFPEGSDVGAYSETVHDPIFIDLRLVYNPGGIDFTLSGTPRRWVVDGFGTDELTDAYPAAPTDNDPVIDFPRCPNDVTSLLTSPNGRVIYSCGARTWYEDDKLLVDKADIYALADDGYFLFGSQPVNVGRFGSDEVFATDLSFPTAVRAIGDLFHVAAGMGGNFSLAEIDHAGKSRSLGVYPTSDNELVRSAALDSQDRLYLLSGPNLFPPLKLTRSTMQRKVELLADFGAMAVEPVLLLAP